MSLLKIMLVSVGMSVIPVLLTEFVIFKYFSTWAMEITNKHFIYHLTLIDPVLFRFYPVFIGAFLAFYNKNVPLKMLVPTVIFAFPCIILSILIGFILGIIIWTNSDNFLIQPFRNYWTLFIFAGMFIPVYLMINKGKTPKKQESVIDEELMN